MHVLVVEMATSRPVEKGEGGKENSLQARKFRTTQFFKTKKIIKNKNVIKKFNFFKFNLILKNKKKTTEKIVNYYLFTLFLLF